MKLISTTCSDVDVTVIAAQRRVIFLVQRAAAVSVCYYDAAAYVRDACITNCESTAAGDVALHVACACDDKTVVVVAASFPPSPAAPSTHLLHSTKLSKKLTCMLLATLPSSERVLCVGDKYGDVTALPTPDVSSRRRTLLTHTAAAITCMAMSLDGRGLVTGDRDEHIRFSRFPSTWDIQSMCLGHLRFVSCLHMIHGSVGAVYAAGQLMLSGGGDGTLRLWHARSGTLLHSLYLKCGAEVAYPGISLTTDGRVARGVEVAAKRPRVDASTGPSIPAGATDVWEGDAGSYTSAGAHADDDMNETGPEEGEGDAAPAGEVVPPVEGDEGEEEEDAAPSGGGIAPAWGRNVFPRLEGLPIIPCALVQHASGLIAAHVDGEAAVRLFAVGMDAAPISIRVPRGQVSDFGDVLPQARVRQVGAVHTSHPPLTLCFKSGSGPATLLVAMLVVETGAFTVEAYTCEVDAEAGTVRGVRLSGPTPWLQSLLGAEYASLMDAKACNAGEEVDVSRVRGCVMGEALHEYDKSVVLTGHRGSEQPHAASAASDADVAASAAS